MNRLNTPLSPGASAHPLASAPAYGMPVRIALVHALQHAIEPINRAFARDWPEAQCMNLVDDSLSADLARSVKGLDDAMHHRFAQLVNYAVGTGANGILFTCSAFGLCIEAVARAHPAIPILKPNEAMVAEAVNLLGPGGKLGLIATFAATLQSMPPEFPDGLALELALAEGALDALNRGDADTHDRLIADQARALAQRGCSHIALAQFSMARARQACEAASGLPVMTTVDSAVRGMRQRLASR